MIGVFSDALTIGEIERILKGFSLSLEDFCVFNRTLDAPRNIRLGVCEGTNSAALEYFSRLNVPVISCSMSPLETITLSSRSPSFCTVTVQRDCPRVDSKTIEPAEYPLKLRKNYSDFTILAVFCILLLNGYEPEII